MKLKKIKTAAEIEAAMTLAKGDDRPLVELTTMEGNVKGVRIGRAHFSIDSYTFAAHREVEHDEGMRYRVTGTVEGFPKAVDYIEDYTEATKKKAGYGSSVETTMDHVKVLIDRRGEVVGEIADGKAVDINGDDIPF